MLRATLVMLSAGLMLAFSAPVQAEGSDNNFTLVNKTGYTLESVYVSPHDAKKWGEDIMGKDTIADGEEVAITFNSEADADHYDVKVVYDDKTEAIWANLELPKLNKLTIHWDAKSQETSAEAE
jgi:hypothetical protein